ncbi:Acetyl-coenzyme A carboxylase carboxyl transferase subunit alpha [Candidatus Protochlamydia amoebophila]|uniref:Acetyl-coenzyme A carboxylase carboxyl transferase subunit alpha n=1 Tax=Candidatus Protochlamydia amoebophila TaxID=362787 RepID=A0A0C1H0U8_9BACT|nr:Acetyl-coenzyme A carboxylase carboxyl transferase subunit alpha [Candidatus Protochlamydia amoebophila]MBS4164519.1 Acetyl-coenzyme A carboxylase carboxyl transferase subunit alpha [Candidatus Protochlamydia amoebophila]
MDRTFKGRSTPLDILPHEKQIHEYIKTIEHLKKQSQDNPIFDVEIQKLEQKLDSLKQHVYSELTPWQRIMICRHPSRPHAVDFIRHLSESFVELAGDRSYREDHAIVGGLAKIGGIKCVVIGQEKGFDTESRVYRNFGMLNPEGFRKALRLMQMAEKFQLPIISLLDTPGAYPGLEAEERGQGWAIARNLREMMRINTPIIITIIGEGCSGGALGMGIGDVIGMLEHAYYSVISPEGCASILWKDASKNVEAASALKLNAEDLLNLKIIDSIIKEPLGGAHHDPHITYQNVKQFLVEQLHILRRIPSQILLEQRYLKFRQMGEFLEG